MNLDANIYTHSGTHTVIQSGQMYGNCVKVGESLANIWVATPSVITSGGVSASVEGWWRLLACSWNPDTCKHAWERAKKIVNETERKCLQVTYIKVIWSYSNSSLHCHLPSHPSTLPSLLLPSLEYSLPSCASPVSVTAFWLASLFILPPHIWSFVFSPHILAVSVLLQWVLACRRHLLFPSTHPHTQRILEPLVLDISLLCSPFYTIVLSSGVGCSSVTVFCFHSCQVTIVCCSL